MEQHTLELSQSLNPDFSIGSGKPEDGQIITPFELALLCGIMVHSMSTFSVDTESSSLSIEWVQEHPI